MSRILHLVGASGLWLGLPGVAQGQTPVELPNNAASSSPFTLVGLYDPTALAVRAGAPPSRWVWSPAPSLEAGCGEAKAPVGLGMMEAQALSDRVSPALIVVLRRDPGAYGPPGPDSLRLALGEGAPEVLLAPAVLPRDLRVEIERIGAPDAGDTLLQLVRTQLEMELCLEHKVGRAWTGGRSADVREAFLLDPPRTSPDRMYFGGQGAPVPALLGPPSACLAGAPPRPTPVRGARAVGLVPSDVWGASLPACIDGATRVSGGLPVFGSDGSELERATPRSTPRSTQRLGVRVSGAGRDDARVVVSLGDTVVLDGPLFVPTKPPEPPNTEPTETTETPETIGTPAAAPTVSSEGMVDLLATLPLHYPEIVGADGARYTLLVVPGWQLGEGLDRLDAASRVQVECREGASPPSPATGGEGCTTGEALEHDRASGRPGVAEILADPSRLWVQARDGEGWLDIGAAVGRSRLDARAWGHPAGRVGARSPVFLVGSEPTALADALDEAHEEAGEEDGEEAVDVAAVAQRAGWQASSLLSVVVLVGAVGAGLLRLRDLWTVMPEERIDYWPGEAPEKAEEADGPDPRSLVEAP